MFSSGTVGSHRLTLIAQVCRSNGRDRATPYSHRATERVIALEVLSIGV